MSQWFASPGIAQGLYFIPIVTGFTLTQTSLALVMDTLVSRSLGTTFSYLTGEPTPPVFRVSGRTIAAPVTETIEMIPSSIAPSEPPQTVTPTLEASAIVIVADVAPLPTVTPVES